jgi:hypothetical protein
MGCKEHTPVFYSHLSHLSSRNQQLNKKKKSLLDILAEKINSVCVIYLMDDFYSPQSG